MPALRLLAALLLTTAAADAQDCHETDPLKVIRPNTPSRLAFSPNGSQRIGRVLNLDTRLVEVDRPAPRVAEVCVTEALRDVLGSEAPPVGETLFFMDRGRDGGPDSTPEYVLGRWFSEARLDGGDLVLERAPTVPNGLWASLQQDVEAGRVEATVDLGRLAEGLDVTLGPDEATVALPDGVAAELEGVEVGVPVTWSGTGVEDGMGSTLEVGIDDGGTGTAAPEEEETFLSAAWGWLWWLVVGTLAAFGVYVAIRAWRRARERGLAEGDTGPASSPQDTSALSASSRTPHTRQEETAPLMAKVETQATEIRNLREWVYESARRINALDQEREALAEELELWRSGRYATVPAVAASGASEDAVRGAPPAVLRERLDALQSIAQTILAHSSRPHDAEPVGWPEIGRHLDALVTELAALRSIVGDGVVADPSYAAFLEDTIHRLEALVNGSSPDPSPVSPSEAEASPARFTAEDVVRRLEDDGDVFNIASLWRAVREDADAPTEIRETLRVELDALLVDTVGMEGPRHDKWRQGVARILQGAWTPENGRALNTLAESGGWRVIDHARALETVEEADLTPEERQRIERYRGKGPLVLTPKVDYKTGDGERTSVLPGRVYRPAR